MVGAALVAAWAGGSGIAQATGDDAAQGPNCIDLTSVESFDVDGSVPDDCGWVPGEGDGDCGILLGSAGEGAESSDPCSVDVTVGVTGDCEQPETFIFTVDATGLEPGTDYEILLTSADVTTDEAPEDGPVVTFTFPTDEDGDVEGFTYTSTEGTFDFPAGAFTLSWLAAGDHEGSVPVFGQTEVGECEVETEPVVTPPAATPTLDAPITTPVAAPVVVTPAVAHPAVLANTGSPVTTAALLGGGLLLAGAGALVATRRRAS